MGEMEEKLEYLERENHRLRQQKDELTTTKQLNEQQLNERLNHVEGILVQRSRTNTGPSRAQSGAKTEEAEKPEQPKDKENDSESREETRQAKRPRGPDSTTNTNSQEDGFVLVERARPNKKQESAKHKRKPRKRQNKKRQNKHKKNQARIWKRAPSNKRCQR
nr:NKAP-like protein [Leptinotarsa decemlineata]